MKARVDTHHHHSGGGHHRDIRLFVRGDDGSPAGVMHFSSMGGLPGPGRLARWKQLERPHVPAHVGRADASTGLKGERMVFESAEDAELLPHENAESGITYLNVGGSKYAISGGAGGVHYIKSLDAAEKVAFLDQFGDNPAIQQIIIDRARQMGLIPPDINTPAQVPQTQSVMLQNALWSALGTGVKTVGLGFLGGLGAGAGWGLGSRLVARDEKKEAAEQDPADSPDAPGESPAAFRPLDPIPWKPADPAATATASMIEARFGHAPGDPL